MNAIAKPAWAEQREGRTFTRVGVTTMLNGAVLSVPMHVITGGELGPTFGIITWTARPRNVYKPSRSGLLA